MAAFATTAPTGSATVPVMVPRSLWANNANADAMNETKSLKARMKFLLNCSASAAYIKARRRMPDPSCQLRVRPPVQALKKSTLKHQPPASQKPHSVVNTQDLSGRSGIVPDAESPGAPL